MRLSELDYELPPELVAQSPAQPRDHSRMLVVDRTNGQLSDRRFFDLVEYLRAGDVLVLNDTQVIPARLVLIRPSGAETEGLFVREHAPGRWELMIRGINRLRPGSRLRLAGSDVELEFMERLTDKTGLVAVKTEVDTLAFLQKHGQVPLPPYIRREHEQPDDRRRYQTVYANAPGAIAAPTAGLHFTDRLLAELRSRDVATATVTLHVGRGTFEPVAVEDLAEHPMHREWYSVSSEAAERINAARQAGGRAVAVGTTAVRVLESASADGALQPGETWTDILIHPPYRFKMVDVLITNFHLPRTTLLALVYAFAGTETARKAYQHAVREGYRFYSYGDAMLVI